MVELFVVRVAPIGPIFLYQVIKNAIAVKLKLLHDVSFYVWSPTLYEEVVDKFWNPAKQKDARDVHVIILLELH